MSAPAGWHLQPDGQERYWDGSRWTDEFRAPLPTDPTAPPSWDGPVDQTQAVDLNTTQAISAPQATPSDYAPAGYAQPDSGQPGYQQPGYAQPGYPQTGYRSRATSSPVIRRPGMAPPAASPTPRRPRRAAWPRAASSPR